MNVMLNMRKIFIVFNFFIIYPLFSESYLNNSSYIAQRGFGETERIAQENALASLSKYFQMSISVKEKERTIVNDSSSQSDISESVFVESETELFAVCYTKAVYNKKQKLYEVEAYINRDEAWEIYKPRLEGAIEPFRKLYQNAKNQKENILKIAGFSCALEKAKENELEKKLDFAQIIKSDQALFYETERNVLWNLDVLIKELCNHCFIKVICENDYEKRIIKSTEQLFSNIGIKPKENSDYLCLVTVEENGNQLPAGFFFTPSFKVEIIKKENVLFSSTRQLKRIGAKNETIAKQRAYSVIANNVAEILRKEFMAYEKAKE